MYFLRNELFEVAAIFAGVSLPLRLPLLLLLLRLPIFPFVSMLLGFAFESMSSSNLSSNLLPFLSHFIAETDFDDLLILPFRINAEVVVVSFAVLFSPAKGLNSICSECGNELLSELLLNDSSLQLNAKSIFLEFRYSRNVPDVRLLM